MTVPKVATLDKYVSTIEKLCSDWGALDTTTHPWFRGQRVASWDLKPGIYRGYMDPKWEREILRDFKLRAGPFLEHSVGAKERPASDLEWLFVMQHYGMPTRLLDWTESYLFALYFAVNDCSGRSDASVWVLDPWELNKISIGAESVPTADDPLLQPYVMSTNKRSVIAQIPVALRPSHASSRITAQKGVFTVHGQDRSGLKKQAQKIHSLDSKIHRIVIRGTAKLVLLRELHRAGVTGSTVFPDLEGLCREIGFRYSRDYIGKHRRSKRTKRARSKPSLVNFPMISTSRTRRRGDSSRAGGGRRRATGSTGIVALRKS